MGLCKKSDESTRQQHDGMKLAKCKSCLGCKSCKSSSCSHSSLGLTQASSQRPKRFSAKTPPKESNTSKEGATLSRERKTSIIRTVVEILDIIRTFPGISNIVLTSDNATTFAGDAWIPFIVEHNAYMHAESGIWISRHIRTEPQTGKDLLDTHFAYVNKQITKYVLDGVENAVKNTNQMFSALTFEGGLPNTTTALVRVDRSACAAVIGSS